MASTLVLIVCCFSPSPPIEQLLQGRAVRGVQAGGAAPQQSSNELVIGGEDLQPGDPAGLEEQQAGKKDQEEGKEIE